MSERGKETKDAEKIFSAQEHFPYRLALHIDFEKTMMSDKSPRAVPGRV